MLKKQASRLFSSARSSSKLINRPRQPSQPLIQESTPTSPQLEDDDLTALPSLSRKDSEVRSGPEPLFRESFISPKKEAAPADSSASVAAHWLNSMTGDLPPLDCDGLSDAPPSYESVVATTVTLVAPGRPKIINLTPQPSVQGRSEPSPKADYGRPVHSRSSSYISGSLLHSRPSSAYSDSSSDFVDQSPATPASTVSAPSLSLSQPGRTRPLSRYNKFTPPRPSKPRSQTQPQFHTGTWFGTPPMSMGEDYDEAI